MESVVLSLSFTCESGVSEATEHISITSLLSGITLGWAASLADTFENRVESRELGISFPCGETLEGVGFIVEDDAARGTDGWGVKVDCLLDEG